MLVRVPVILIAAMLLLHLVLVMVMQMLLVIGIQVRRVVMMVIAGQSRGRQHEVQLVTLTQSLTHCTHEFETSVNRLGSVRHVAVCLGTAVP